MNLEVKDFIMIVEDSDDDYMFIERSFKKFKFDNPLLHIPNGEQALAYLFRRGEYQAPEKSPRPKLILLDLNLLGTSGKEVLEELKGDNELKKIPVIVLTTSTDPRDVDQCFASGANSYLVKPADFQGFIDAMQKLKEFWFDFSLLPNT